MLILKFFLHVSKEEQRQRFLARLEEPAKRWKFAMGDVAERKLWDKYMHAYEEAIRHTSTDEAPWYVVPADNKWFARLVIAEAMVDAIEKPESGISESRRCGAEGTGARARRTDGGGAKEAREVMPIRPRNRRTAAKSERAARSKWSVSLTFLP